MLKMQTRMNTEGQFTATSRSSAHLNGTNVSACSEFSVPVSSDTFQRQASGMNWLWNTAHLTGYNVNLYTDTLCVTMSVIVCR